MEGRKPVEAYEALELAAAKVARRWSEDNEDEVRTKAGHRAEENAVAAIYGAAVYLLVDIQYSRPPAELRLGTPAGQELTQILENMQAKFLEILLV
jgi:hypothetical protein